jgi:16S rRNA (guanine966-N2)-methyltransferase
MRIIGGKYRGRRLAVVRGDIRPTSDRMRETLFNVLGDSVTGSVWFDAFAGSGAVGIEALSRGARHVVFNDRSREAVRLLKKNLERCGIEEGFEVHERDVFTAVRKGPAADFIYLDPPFEFGRYEKLLAKVCYSPVFGDGALVMLEMFKKTRLKKLPEGIAEVRRLQSGDTVVLLFRSGTQSNSAE